MVFLELLLTIPCILDWLLCYICEFPINVYTPYVYIKYSCISFIVLQLTASPWTTKASTRERWQFGAFTNRKATSSNRAPSTSSHYCY